MSKMKDRAIQQANEQRFFEWEQERKERLNVWENERADRNARALRYLETKFAQKAKNNTPSTGKLILCLFIPIEKQQERLADFQEMLINVWIPNFGKRIGSLVYTWHALRSAGAMIRVGITAAIVDRIVRALWR